MKEMTTVERAFGIAQSGSVRSLAELRKVLRDEGYTAAMQHTEGRLIQRQLKDAMAKAQE